MSGQSGGHRLRLSMLNDQLTCKLCHGYFIDATTIIECLHSFCRSCIVKYLENNKYCPICEVQIHKSKPLLNIRPDHTLQDIVYKLVPACYQNEMRCRRDFYAKNPEALRSTTSPEARGEPVESHIYSPDESLSLSLEYYNPVDQPIIGELGVDDVKETSGARKQHEHKEQNQLQQKVQPKRYLRCPAAVMVFHLQKLIRSKYGLSDAHRVDVMYKEETLCDSYTLMDVMYIYHWRRKVPLHLSYRIFESSPKRLKLDEDNDNFKQSLTNAGISPLDPQSEPQVQQQQQQPPQQQQNTPGAKSEWKEVQLKISETGVISVTDITSPDSKKNSKTEKKVSPSSSSTTGVGSAEEEKRKRLDVSIPAANVNKSDKTSSETSETKINATRRETKVAADSLSKISEKKKPVAISEVSKSIGKIDASKTSQETLATLQKSGGNSSSEANFLEEKQQSSSEKNTISRESRSRSDLRSASSQEAAQSSTAEQQVDGKLSSEVQRGKTSSGIVEKLNPPKRLEAAVQSTKEDEKQDNKSTNNNLDTNITSDTTMSRLPIATSQDSSSCVQAGNIKSSSKILESKNSTNQQTSAGSKIDALSAKLQFQPKIGEVNNTYSKKTPKDKRSVMDKVLKKSSTQASSSSNSSVTTTCSSPSSSSSSSSSSSCSSSTESTLTVRTLSKNSGESLKNRANSSSSTQPGSGKSVRIDSNQSISITSSTGNQTSQIMNCLGGGTTISSTYCTAPSSSVSLSVTTIPTNSGINRRGSESSTSVTSIIDNQPSRDEKSTTHQATTMSGNQNSGKNCYGRRENQSLNVPSSESLASIGLNVSTSMQTATTFPYLVQDLVNSEIMKNSPVTTKVSGLTIQKTTGMPHQSLNQQQQLQQQVSNSTGATSQACSSIGTSFNLHPSMSIYSIPTSSKNNLSGNLSSSLYSNATSHMTNSSNVGGKISNAPIGGSKTVNSNLEITSVYSVVPPCPDAIPISLIKPTGRKHEVIAKGTNLNEICAKIGENSKEKNKAESRSRPEVPDLLKITKKPSQSSLSSPSSAASSGDSIVAKLVSNIPNVPIYTPSNSLAASGDSKMSYTSKEPSLASTTKLSSFSSSAQSSPSLQIGKPRYKTPGVPTKCWNPPMSKNNFALSKNQTKESLQSSQQTSQGSAMIVQQQQQQQQQQEVVGNVKTIGMKRADSAKRRNPLRFLGNPASGVKPLYGPSEGKSGGVNETRDSGTTATTHGTISSGKNSSLSMTKIDPKTLSPIVSTSNSPIVSPPPYSPSARGTCYQSFSREMCARSGGGGSPISSRNSPVNMLSTNPFIPSVTPNTHPRLILPHYIPPFPQAPRFSNPLIRSPIGIPSSAFHSSLPPSINKPYQRTSYMPQTTGVYSQQQISQPPAVQRIPASSGHGSSSSGSSSSPKSPKKSNSPGASFVMKTETQTSTGNVAGDAKNVMLLAKVAHDTNAFNLSKTGVSQQQPQKQVKQQTGSSMSESCPKESVTTSKIKHENSAKTKEAERQRRSSSENDRSKIRDEKDRTEESGNLGSLKVSMESESASKEESSKESRDGDSRSKRETEKIGTKANGDLSSDNNSPPEASKIQHETHARDEGKVSRSSDSEKTNFSRETKDSDGNKQTLQQISIAQQQGNNNPSSDRIQGTKDSSNESKAEEQQQISKSGEQIQGKNTKTTNAESQRNKAES